MSYKDFLGQKIAELERQIQTATGEKQALQSALNELKLKEFEEDMRTENHQQLLKGWCCKNTTGLLTFPPFVIRWRVC